MGTNLKIELSDEVKLTDSVKANIYRLWDSNSLTLLGVLLGIWLAVFFGITTFLNIFLGLILATLSLVLCLVLLKWSKSRNFLINFMRKLLE